MSSPKNFFKILGTISSLYFFFIETLKATLKIIAMKIAINIAKNKSDEKVNIKVPKRIAKIKQTIKFILALLFIASKSVFILSFSSFVIIHLH